jgi:hypothetical protein
MYGAGEISALLSGKEYLFAPESSAIQRYNWLRSVSTRRRFVPMSLIPSREEERT